MKRFFYSSSGNSLTQYAIIIGLVSICIIPAYFLLGKNIVEQLTNFGVLLGTDEVTNNSSGTGASTSLINNDKIVKDPTVTNPDVKTSCTKDSCTIDFGEYTLTGIPDNFGEFIETAGSSGGTDVLVDILKQIAKNPDLTSEQANLIEQLANKGHSLSSIEEMIEDQAQILVDNGTAPDENFEMDGDVLSQRLTEFSDLFKLLEASLATTPEAKALVGVLSNDIVGLATDMSLAHQVAINSCAEEGSCTSSVLTGATVETEPYNLSLDDILNPEAASVTDLDSSLICASGGSSDDGETCN